MSYMVLQPCCKTNYKKLTWKMSTSQDLWGSTWCQVRHVIKFTQISWQQLLVIGVLIMF